eukprot:1195837-Prorocentrum_minimum.AAC.4
MREIGICSYLAGICSYLAGAVGVGLALDRRRQVREVEIPAGVAVNVAHLHPPSPPLPRPPRLLHRSVEHRRVVPRRDLYSRERTHQTQAARVYSYDGPIRRKQHRHILMMDQSDARSAGIFLRRTNQTR